MCNISVFRNVSSVDNPEDIYIKEFFEKIRDGEWEDLVTKYRVLSGDEQKKFKLTVPTATMSGTFFYRNDSGIKSFSGYLAMDIDDVDEINEVRKAIERDIYTVACYVSIGGRGLRVLYRIKQNKYKEAFSGLCKYIYENFGLTCDLNSSISKPYLVSFDPFCYIRYDDENIPLFELYPPKQHIVKKIPDFVYVPSDLETVIKNIVARHINICEDYHDWLKIGFAISDCLGEDGRFFFHEISKFSPKYRHVVVDKQYTQCLRAKGSNKVSISTLYYFAKQNGIPIVTESTKKIVRTTKYGKAAGLSKKQITENLLKNEGIDNAEKVVDQVFDSNENFIEDEDPMLPQLEMFITNNYSLKMNEVTGYLEQHGVILPTRSLYTIFIAAKKILPKLDYNLFMKLLKSEFIESYNPFFSFLGSDGIPVELPALPPVVEPHYESPLIDKLCKSIENDNPSYTRTFVRKWYVSMISAMHRVHSPLILVLVGKQVTGKTEFFRRLLPQQLQAYYAESKLDKEKDDELLMTENIIVMDDEFGGKSKQESKKLNNITSKQWFSVRRPYGDHNEKILRLAILCGTSNYFEVVSDPTGNRRIIPVVVDNINKELYNSIDKVALINEAFKLYKSGFDWRIIGNDITYLNNNQTEHEMLVKERELINGYYEPGEKYRMTTTDILVELEHITGQRLSLYTIGTEMKRAGFIKKGTRYGGGSKTAQMWCVDKINRRDQQPFNTSGESPF